MSGGGLPGWLQRNKAQLRSTDPEFVNTTRTYIAHVGKIISEAEINKGGPVILFQPENEYSLCSGFQGIDEISSCLDKRYMKIIQDEYRKAGITVPMHSNDALPIGNFKPGSGVGETDIYGYDFYPLSWGQEPCNLRSDNLRCLAHGKQAPIIPIGIVEVSHRPFTRASYVTSPSLRVPDPLSSFRAAILIDGKKPLLLSSMANHDA